MKPSDYIRKGWCQNSSALTEHGVAVDENDPLACKWCLYGAFKASGNGSVDGDAWRKLRDRIGPPIAWNDESSRTQAEVIAALESVGL